MYTKSLAKILLIFLSICLIWIAFIAPHPIQAATQIIGKQATLRAYISSGDNLPPSAPDTLKPSGDICDNRPTFSWRKSTDNIGVTRYHFKVHSSDYSYVFETNVNENFENDDFRVWVDNDIYYLIIKDDLAWGTYDWEVTAYDSAGNYTTSTNKKFAYLEENCVYNCDNSPSKNFTISQPSSQINTLNPALVLDFENSELPSSFEVIVNGTSMFNNVPVATADTGDYVVNVDGNRVSFQPRSDYLVATTNSSQSYTLTIVVRDNNSCSFARSINTVYLPPTPPTTCPNQTPIASPLYPVPDSEIDTLSPTFSWQVCGSADCFTGITFSVNGRTYFSGVAPTSQTDNDYSLAVNTLEYSATCGGPATNFNVNLTDGGNVFYNDPNDPTDNNTWQVGTTAENGLTSFSPHWRFRVLRYYWCTSAHGNCAWGNKAQCGATGAPCYGNEQACNDNAQTDCASIITGGGEGEDKTPPGIFGNTGEGFPGLDDAWPSFSNAWEILRGLNLSNIFSGEFWQELGSALAGLTAGLVAIGFYFYPAISLFGLLPIGILIIIFPQPKGLVFDSMTLKPIKNALLSLQVGKTTLKAWITSKNGLYNAVKLESGKYEIVVSHPEYYFPTIVNPKRRKKTRSYYRGTDIRVKNNEQIMAVYMIPLDNIAWVEEGKISTNQNKNQDNYDPHWFDKLRLFVLRLVNALSLVYGISFVIVIFMTIIYPNWLNYLIFVVYAIGWCRRALMLRRQVNITGKITNKDNRALANVILKAHLLANDQFAALVRTDAKGEFNFYLSPGEIYSLSLGEDKDLEIIDEHDNLSRTVIIEATKKKQDFNLKVKE